MKDVVEYSVGPIASAHIHWNTDCANSPELVVQLREGVDVQFKHDDPIWTKDENGMVWAEKQGFVSFISMGAGMVDDDYKGMRGYGGAHFQLHLKDGTVVESNNAWSGRASVVSFPCTEVIMVKNDCRYASAISLELYKKICSDLGVYLHGNYEGREVEISCSPDKVTKPGWTDEDIDPII
ncbi:MAG: hypothetical protein ACQ5SW_00180 [Sphaerochaetaceae bacterium]